MSLLTFKLRKHSPSYRGEGEHMQVMASFDTFDECAEMLRGHYLYRNQLILDKAKELEIPECIMELARTNVARNPDIVITVNDDGVVFVDGQGPEMDYYTIRGE